MTVNNGDSGRMVNTKLLAYLESRNMLVHVDYTECEIDEKMIRVCGDTVCKTCGKTYYKHPFIDNVIDMASGAPWLHLLCDGTLGKT